MAHESDRRIGMIFGVLGAVLLVLAGLVALIAGVVFLAFGHSHGALGSFSQSVIFVVIGLVIGAISLLGRTPGGDRALVAGIVLIVLAVVGWFALGFGGGVLAILGAVFTLIGGIFFLVGSR